jgi:hypothetical protein
VDAQRTGPDVGRKLQGGIEELITGYLGWPPMRGHFGGSDRSRHGARSSQLHEERFVIEPEIVADCTIVGQAALKAEVVAVSSVRCD